MANDLALRDLLLDGGLSIETRLSDDPQSSVVLRTVLQLDGDSVVMVDSALVGPPPAADWQAIAERHRAAVDAAFSQISAEFGRGLQLMRGALVAAGLASEYPTVASMIEHGLSALATDWISTGLHQLPLVALMASARLLPRLLRMFRRGNEAGDRARREISHQVYMRMQKGEKLLA